MAPPAPDSPPTPDPPQSAPRLRKPRGFAVMSQEDRSRISRLGGKAAHAEGTAHTFTSDEAKAAGRKGGQATARRRKG